MYTQCQYCKAIFHVNMREITVAKGYLRCGECLKTFKATKTLSTTIPKKFEEEIPEEQLKKEIEQELNDVKVAKSENTGGFEIDIRTKDLRSIPITNTKIETKQVTGKLQVGQPKKKRKLWPTLLALTLFLILIAQIVYHYRGVILNTPTREPDKIQMLTHNVFVHPNEPRVLLITATFENTADHSQPYPVLELSLNNSQSTIVALRRFKPEEYLENYTKGMLFPAKSTSTLKLKIKDPGKLATRFQFSFL